MCVARHVCNPHLPGTPTALARLVSRECVRSPTVREGAD
jgi:hypothetical protein